jgi:hypothetical protein
MVMMNMISSTSITSISGVVLMSHHHVAAFVADDAYVHSHGVLAPQIARAAACAVRLGDEARP